MKQENNLIKELETLNRDAVVNNGLFFSNQEKVARLIELYTNPQIPNAVKAKIANTMEQRDSHRAILQQAIYHGNKDVVQALSKIPDIDFARRDYYKYDAALLAVQRNQPEILQLIIDKDEVDFNAMDKYGKGLLELATENKNDAMVLMIQEAQTRKISQDLTESINEANQEIANPGADTLTLSTDIRQIIKNEGIEAAIPKLTEIAEKQNHPLAPLKLAQYYFSKNDFENAKKYAELAKNYKVKDGVIDSPHNPNRVKKAESLYSKIESTEDFYAMANEANQNPKAFFENQEKTTAFVKLLNNPNIKENLPKLLNSQFDPGKNTILHLAATQNSKPIVEVIMDKHFYPYITNANGETAYPALLKMEDQSFANSFAERTEDILVSDLASAINFLREDEKGELLEEIQIYEKETNKKFTDLAERAGDLAVLTGSFVAHTPRTEKVKSFGEIFALATAAAEKRTDEVNKILTNELNFLKKLKEDKRIPENIDISNKNIDEILGQFIEIQEETLAHIDDSQILSDTIVNNEKTIAAMNVARKNLDSLKTDTDLDDLARKATVSDLSPTFAERKGNLGITFENNEERSFIQSNGENVITFSIIENPVIDGVEDPLNQYIRNDNPQIRFVIPPDSKIGIIDLVESIRNNGGIERGAEAIGFPLKNILISSNLKPEFISFDDIRNNRTPDSEALYADFLNLLNMPKKTRMENSIKIKTEKNETVDEAIQAHDTTPEEKKEEPSVPETAVEGEGKPLIPERIRQKQEAKEIIDNLPPIEIEPHEPKSRPRLLNSSILSQIRNKQQASVPETSEEQSGEISIDDDISSYLPDSSDDPETKKETEEFLQEETEKLREKIKVAIDNPKESEPAEKEENKEEPEHITTHNTIELEDVELDENPAISEPVKVTTYVAGEKQESKKKETNESEIPSAPLPFDFGEDNPTTQTANSILTKSFSDAVTDPSLNPLAPLNADRQADMEEERRSKKSIQTPSLV